MANTVKIDGLDRLVSALDKMGDTIMPAMSDAAWQGAQAVLDRARANLASFHGNGDLSRSLHVSRGKLKRGTYFVACYVTWNDDVRDYAAPLELGHYIRLTNRGPVVGRVPQHPFLRPAADKSKRDIANWMIDAINKEIEKLGD